MKLNIVGRVFDTDEIKELLIKENNKEVFVTTEEDFYRIRYRTESEIEDVIYWKKLENITTKDVTEAVYTLIITCEYFINSKHQCKDCPLKKNTNCLFFDIPYNWR